MAFGVYKAYKSGDCSDSPYIWIFETEEEAKQVVAKMEEMRLDGSQRDQYWAGNEGWEFRAYWTYEEVGKPISMDEFNQQIKDGLEDLKSF